jgi:hypothetical protein
MTVIEKWKWRVLSAGRWATTRHAVSESNIRRQHPEAVRVESTRITVEVADVVEVDASPQHRPSGRSMARDIAKDLVRRGWLPSSSRGHIGRWYDEALDSVADETWLAMCELMDKRTPY